MKLGRRQRGATLALLGLTAAALAAAPATSPKRAATTSAPASQATVDPAAAPLLDRLAAAYASPAPRQVTGDIAGEFDVGLRRKTYTMHVIGRTDGSGRFIHDAGSAGLIVNDGQVAYLYDRRRDAFAKFDGFATRRPPDKVHSALIDVLLDENPALLLSLTDDPVGLLRRSVDAIRPATQPNGLVLERDVKHITLRLADDGAIVSSEIDYAPLMKLRNAQAVKAARATLTYTASNRDAVPTGTFAWQPPASASEFELDEELLNDGPATMPSTSPASD